MHRTNTSDICILMRYFGCKLNHIQGLGIHFLQRFTFRCENYFTHQLSDYLFDGSLINLSYHLRATARQIFDLTRISAVKYLFLRFSFLIETTALNVFYLQFVTILKVVNYFVVLMIQ